jgi:hypothetical protein
MGVYTPPTSPLGIDSPDLHNVDVAKDQLRPELAFEGSENTRGKIAEVEEHSNLIFDRELLHPRGRAPERLLLFRLPSTHQPRRHLYLCLRLFSGECGG